MSNKIAFKISGMKCHSCARIIKHGLEEEAGINSADVDYDSAKACLEFSPEEINPSEIKNKIKNLGYIAIEQ